MPTNIRERVYIYASLQPGDLPKHEQQTGKTFDTLQREVIVGSVEINDCKWMKRMIAMLISYVIQND